jgi:hypothetical protein
VLYSPVLTETQMNADVPAAWPGAEKFDEDGNSLGLKSFFEYTQWHEVTGGYCIKYSSGPADDNKNIKLPTFAQLKVWVNKAGGFLTKEEFDAIRTVVDTP